MRGACSFICHSIINFVWFDFTLIFSTGVHKTAKPNVKLQGLTRVRIHVVRKGVGV